MRELQHLEEEKQLWLVPDVQKEMAPDYFGRLEKDAAAGNPKAEATLGLCYEMGYGIKRDLAKALHWYKRAADAGHAGAQNNLAHLYDSGAGVPLDHAKAHKLYVAAAGQGLADAQFNVGLDFAIGVSLPQNWQEARQWYEKAAAQGYLPALNNLGNIYLLGRGTPIDLDKAAQYLQKPAEAGIVVAQYGYYVYYESKNNLDEANKWLKRSAEGGYWAGQYHWALALSNGTGVPKDPNEALIWARRAVTRMSSPFADVLADCHALLARILLTMENDADAIEAYREAKLAADAGSAEGEFLVGICYHRGAGVRRDLTAAAKWYRLAAEQNDPDAAQNLAYFLEKGEGVAPDIAEAIKWYRVGVQGGNPLAKYWLGLCYRDGKGVDINLQEAEKLLHQAAEDLPSFEDIKSALAGVESQLRWEHGETLFNSAVNLVNAAQNGSGSMTEAAKVMSEAAELGHPRAIAILALMYRLGDGVPADENRAEQLIAKVENTSDPATLCQIGASYMGRGVGLPDEKYLERAIGFFRRSAVQGYAPSENVLGFYYMSMPEGKRDNVEAIKWLTLSAVQGNANARFNLNRLRPNLTPAQIEEGEKRAREFVPHLERRNLPLTSDPLSQKPQ